MISEWLPQYQKLINIHISRLFASRWVETDEMVERQFESALIHGVEAGGKRLRPILTILAYEEFSTHEDAPHPDSLLDTALGIECLHASTLIHDDLPAIDNDEWRRGKPTVWKQFGEPTALLSGDALMALGFELLAHSWQAEIIREIARAVGDLGIMRGQVRDTLLRQDHLDLDSLLRLHDEKTGWLIAGSLVVGAMMAGTKMSRKIEKLREFGKLLGRAFQIRDDILDYEGDPALVGKITGKDITLGKGIVANIGIDRSRELLSSYERSMRALTQDFQSEKWGDIISFIIERES